MSDLISRQEAIETVRRSKRLATVSNGEHETILIDKAQVQKELMMLPSAEPEIIRCENCKRNYGSKHNPMCDFMSAHLWPDSFCSYGEEER